MFTPSSSVPPSLSRQHPPTNRQHATRPLDHPNRQAEFAATKPCGDVAALARALVVPSLAPALYLYTTPPKQLLKDMAATLYDLKLVPAAHIHVGVDAGKLPAEAVQGGWLRPEVAALMSNQVPDPLAGRAGGGGGGSAGGRQGDEAAEAHERERVLAEARRRAASAVAGGDGEGEKKVPKWLKMGGK